MEAYKITATVDAVAIYIEGTYVGARFVWGGEDGGRHSTQTVPMYYGWLSSHERLPDNKYMSLDEHYDTSAANNDCKVMDCLREEAYGACEVYAGVDPYKEDEDAPDEVMDEVDEKHHFIFDKEGHLYWPEL